jgi:hypothetical protein
MKDRFLEERRGYVFSGQGEGNCSWRQIVTALFFLFLEFDVKKVNDMGSQTDQFQVAK